MFRLLIAFLIVNGGRYNPWKGVFGGLLGRAARVMRLGGGRTPGALPSNIGTGGGPTAPFLTRVAGLSPDEPTPQGNPSGYVMVVADIPRDEELEKFLREFHWHCYIEPDADPDSADARARRLDSEPELVRFHPVELAEWISKVTYDKGSTFEVWDPIRLHWTKCGPASQSDMRGEYISVASQGMPVYAAVETWQGGRLAVYAEAVTGKLCSKHINPWQES